MAVWSDDDEIVCLHPNGQRLVGHARIRDSWRAILGNGKRLQVRVTRAVRWAGAMLAIHNVIETLYVDNQPGKVPVAATNVYVRGPTGWRMLVHHASPIAGGEAPGEAGGDPDRDPARPKVLH
jgi:ketosteroid isomerase-like protein